ncbi:hypothetical protein [Ferrimonas marina]|uniref:hypothetical protein n=1 Tax=Ferrimonas marina TaxID=299255 RepID=UPI000B03094A|nr:hypothetical protein [Ferrimonas marina]
MRKSLGVFTADFLKVLGVLALLQWAVRIGFDPEFHLPHLLDLAFASALGLCALRARWR